MVDKLIYHLPKNSIQAFAAPYIPERATIAYTHQASPYYCHNQYFYFQNPTNQEKEFKIDAIKREVHVYSYILQMTLY